MDTTAILAVITTDKQKLAGGGVPVFVVDDQERLHEVSASLSNILDASAHEIHSDVMIIVKHE